MSDQQNRRETIVFCQLLSVSLRSGQPLPEALSHLGASLDNQAALWAKNLAQKLSQGHPVEEICREMAGFDPVLARLMPLLGDGRLLRILEIYTGFLVNLERVRDNLKSALFYPTVVVGLLLANLLQLNFGLFQQVYLSSSASAEPLPLALRALYFAEPGMWPMALPIPLLMLIAFIGMFRSMAIVKIDSRSLLARLARFSEALRLQETGRIQGVISLYLQAGQPLVKAVANAAELASDFDAASLALVAKSLGDGETPAGAFSFSPVLQNFAEGTQDAETLAERIEYASESNYRHSYSLLRNISNKMMLVALLLTGLFVLLVTSGAFGSYYWAVWSI
ncbi:MAG TPA: type II secretion system F family protein [Candidatus Rifleibacterium sp.]|nr:type II secretion system F family protein [Candidatus Rifleibacterium sp.]HPT46335.1 type II secretion system F family protein [Candidatus Rifleibacterium sp.]